MGTSQVTNIESYIQVEREEWKMIKTNIIQSHLIIVVVYVLTSQSTEEIVKFYNRQDNAKSQCRLQEIITIMKT